MIKSRASELTIFVNSFLLQLIEKRHLGHGIVKPSQNWAGSRGVGGRWREGGMWMCSQLRCDSNCWCVCISWLSCGNTLYVG